MAPQDPPLRTALGADAPAGEINPGVEEVLDAALAQFEDIGVRRSTIEDIARRARIDRVTVYRRIGSKDDLIQAVLAREARRLIDRIDAATAPLATLDERIATAFATAIVHLRENALFNRMLALDSDTMLPRVTTQAGSLLAIGIAAAAHLLQRAQDDSLLEPIDDPQGVAEVLVRLIQSFVLTPNGALKLQTSAQLETFARAHLTAIVTRGGQSPPSRPAAT
ncbi:MAG TPA: helix-turn-helix domain-containing protein [Solirubrobacteraceae bacterium]|jgi:AcrR family transcriptional regulator